MLVDDGTLVHGIEHVFPRTGIVSNRKPRGGLVDRLRQRTNAKTRTLRAARIVRHESGGIGIPRHLPERDGILNALLLANVMADEKKTLGQLVASLQQDFGQHHYARERQSDRDCADRPAGPGRQAAGGR